MRIITDGFEALDAVDFAAKEGCTFTVKPNTITVKDRFIPKMAKFQIRTKGLDSDTLNNILTYIKTNS